MKVMVLTDAWFPFIGGGQINAWEISKRLAKQGIHLDIITRNFGLDNLPKIKNIHVYKLGKKTSPQDSLSKLLFVPRSYLFVRSKKYDLVHAHAFLPGITAKFLMLTTRKPAVFTVHGTSLINRLNGSLSTLLEKIILTKLRYTTQITVSRDFLKIPNVNNDITFVTNGSNIHKLKSEIKTKRTKGSLLCVARLHPQKNLTNLIKAINIIKKENKNVQLKIAGSGPQKNELRLLISKLKLSTHVHLLGNVKAPELLKLYTTSQLLVLPSIYEGQSLAILDAFECKLPVVASSTGDTPFMIRDFKNGFLVDNPEDPNEIARVLQKALNYNNLSQIAQNAYNLSKDKYTWDIAAKKTLQIYESCLK